MPATPATGPDEPAHHGRDHYPPRLLRISDPLVLGVYARLVWRCPTPRLVTHYERNLRRRHLDVGPGTGYFLARARLPLGCRLTLADPSPQVLAHASRRLSHLRPTVIEADVGQPPGCAERFQSAALSYVLHRLPGPMADKAAAVRHTAQVLEPDGVLFGATVLGTDARHTPLSRGALRVLNRRGIFHNLADTAHGLQEVLGASFTAVDVQVVGSVALFRAVGPR